MRTSCDNVQPLARSECRPGSTVRCRRTSPSVCQDASVPVRHITTLGSVVSASDPVGGAWLLEPKVTADGIRFLTSPTTELDLALGVAMRKAPFLVPVSVVLLLGGTVLAPSPAAASDRLTFYRGTGIEYPQDITAGPDGSLWFTNTGNDSVGRITTGGAVAYYPVASEPFGITAGPGDALWFTEPSSNAIGRITTAGVVSHFSGTGVKRPFAITDGSGGARSGSPTRATIRSAGSPPPGWSRITPGSASTILRHHHRPRQGPVVHQRRQRHHRPDHPSWKDLRVLRCRDRPALRHHHRPRRRSVVHEP